MCLAFFCRLTKWCYAHSISLLWLQSLQICPHLQLAKILIFGNKMVERGIYLYFCRYNRWRRGCGRGWRTSMCGVWWDLDSGKVFFESCCGEFISDNSPTFVWHLFERNCCADAVQMLFRWCAEGRMGGGQGWLWAKKHLSENILGVGFCKFKIFLYFCFVCSVDNKCRRAM